MPRKERAYELILMFKHTPQCRASSLNSHRCWFSKSNDQDCCSVLVLNWKEIFVLFLAALGLCCCTQTFCSCGQQGLLSSCSVRTSHCDGFSCFRAQAAGRADFSNCRWTSQNSCNVGLVAKRHVEPSRIRDQTRVPSIGGQILNHWTTGKSWKEITHF